MHYRVVADHVRSHDNAICFERGESIRVEQPDARYPGWWWCTDRRGRSGRVHESYFEEEDYRFVAREDYDARELTVCAGEVVEALDVRGDWALCRNSARETGWVPLAKLAPVANC
ncbi:MAG: hypothetical protein KatS3mg052_1556 [Candidatus Roseilinea sp.]|nr:MAG: hypothetical protein KatS3mg052_1556 [Candidatus Roseilinea sp.]